MNDRKPFLAGNWKMHGTIAEAEALASGLRMAIGDPGDREVAVFPPLTALPAVLSVLEGSPIRVGAQNCHQEERGAFTGEVSAEMLRDAGCELVLVGHSERRHIFGETDQTVREKLLAAYRAGLEPVLCVGELLPEREAGRTREVVRRQLLSAVGGLSRERAAALTIAYEPVWAIGTGRTAGPDQAQEVHAFLRGLLAETYDGELAEGARIQYGGSVKPANIRGLMHEPDIDGALVGGASLDAASFAAIVRYDGVEPC